MKYSVKMIKIPIDLYNKLTHMGTSANENANVNFNENFDEQETKPIKLAQRQMEHLIQNRGMPSDVKSLKYIQEFKRAQKLARDRAEKPINVKVQNISDLADLAKAESAKSFVPSSRETEEELTDLDDDDNDSEIAKSQSTSESSVVEKIKGISDYIEKNRKKLGLNANFQLMEKRKGKFHTLKTSDIGKIIRYHFQTSPKGKYPPTGYHKFMQRCKKDSFLKEELKCDFDDDGDSEQEKSESMGYGKKFTSKSLISGSGIGSLLKRDRKSYKFSHPRTSFKFKPKLWKIIYH